MRIVIDLATAADAAIDLALILARTPHGHAVVAVLDGTWSDHLHTAQQRLRTAFSSADIVLWHPPADDPAGLATSLIRAAVIAGLAPDILLLAVPPDARTAWPDDLPAPVTLPAASLALPLEAPAVWDALQRHLAAYPAQKPSTAPPRRLKLAHLGPLLPDASGVAEVTSSILPELHRHYDVTLFAPDPAAVDPALRAAYTIEATADFPAMAGRFERIVAQLGNSPYHREPGRLLRQFPGVAVLHDTMLGDFTENLVGPAFAAAVFETEGWPAAISIAAHGPGPTMRHHACLWPLPPDALGAVVHSAHAKAMLREASNIPSWQSPLPLLYGEAAGKQPLPPRDQARALLGIATTDLLVVCFGAITPAKCPLLVRSSFTKAFDGDHRARLVFAGEVLAGPVPAAQERIAVTGRLTADAWRHWLAAADIAVQLRRDSRGETSGAVMDALAAGVPTIANAHGAMAELPADAVLLLPENLTPHDLADALATLAADPALRARLGAAGRAHVTTAHAPETAVAHYVAAIEAAYATSSSRGAAEWLLRRLANTPVPVDSLAPAVAASLPAQSRRRLLVDVSIVARQDIGTGIQRVTREIARRLVALDTPGWRIETLRGDANGLVLARDWAAGQLGIACPAPDELAEIGAGDRILLLDFPGMVEPRDMLALRQAQARGAELVFVVYDLLPLLHPEWFPPAEQDHSAAYQAQMFGFVDAALCISRAVADELACALDTGMVLRNRALDIGWFHLGSDFRPDIAGAARPDSVATALAAMTRMPSLLMVGTVEPRKGHAQALGSDTKQVNRG